MEGCRIRVGCGGKVEMHRKGSRSSGNEGEDDGRVYCTRRVGCGEQVRENGKARNHPLPLTHHYHSPPLPTTTTNNTTTTTTSNKTQHSFPAFSPAALILLRLTCNSHQSPSWPLLHLPPPPPPTPSPRPPPRPPPILLPVNKSGFILVSLSFFFS